MKIPSALLMLLFLSGCGGSPTDIKAKEYKGRLEDKAQGLAFRCPEKWEIRENVHGQRAIGRSPRETPQDAFQENLVVSGPLKAEGPDQLMATCQAQLAKELKGFKQVSVAPTQLDFLHQQQGQSLRCRQWLHPNGKGAYWVVTFTSTETEFARWEPEFNKIWASFAAGSSAPAAPAASAAPATPTPQPLPATPGAATPTPVSGKPTATPQLQPGSTPKPASTPAASPLPRPLQSPVNP